MSTRNTMIGSALLLLAACSEPPPPPPAPAPSASDTLRQDEKAIAERFAKSQQEAAANADRERARNEQMRLAGLLRAHAVAWRGKLDEASKGGRGKLPELMKEMGVLRDQTGTLETNPCTARAAATLSSHMNGALAAFDLFGKGTGEPDKAAKDRLQQAMAEYQAFEEQLEGCLPK